MSVDLKTSLRPEDFSVRRIFEPFKTIARFDEPLAKYTSFKIGGPAEVLLIPTTREYLIQCYQLCLKHQLPVHIMGGGTNLLISDNGVQGVVLKPELVNLQVNQSEIIVEPGYSLAHLVTKSINEGLQGLEGLAGIPGTVGGAVIMNAGGKYGTIGKQVKSVLLINQQGELEQLEPAAHQPHEPEAEDRFVLEFGYRESNFKDKGIIIEINLHLEKGEQGVLQERFHQVLTEKKDTQPLASYSAGCVFKNPPEGPSAGELIEQAGLKGQRIGGAEISTKHANFIINQGSALAKDVQTLIKKIQETVFSRCGVRLELELQIWG